MNFADDMEIAFSPDEDQAVFISESFITILCRDNGVSFDFWLRKMSRLGRLLSKHTTTWWCAHHFM